MPQISYAPETHEDFARFKNFLQEVAPEKISEATDAIFEGLETVSYTHLTLPTSDLV